MKNLNAVRTSDLTRSQFVRVRFPSGSVLDSETDFYFGSLSAVFDMFSEKELGVNLRTLYKENMVAGGFGYTSPLGVEFKKLTMYRKRHKN